MIANRALRTVLPISLVIALGACDDPATPGGTLYHNGSIVTMEAGGSVEAVVTTDNNDAPQARQGEQE